MRDSKSSALVYPVQQHLIFQNAFPNKDIAKTFADVFANNSTATKIIIGT